MVFLEKISNTILNLLEELEGILNDVDINNIAMKTNKQHRTVKQIVGHLCDSAFSLHVKNCLYLSKLH